MMVVAIIMDKILDQYRGLLMSGSSAQMLSLALNPSIAGPALMLGCSFATYTSYTKLGADTRAKLRTPLLASSGLLVAAAIAVFIMVYEPFGKLPRSL
jgi:hypothetical protein